MDKSGLRVISFVNPSGVAELHLHNNNVMPGQPANNVKQSHVISAIRLMTSIGENHIISGNNVQIQAGPENFRYDVYKDITNKLAERAGKSVYEVGDLPLTSMPWVKSKAFHIK